MGITENQFDIAQSNIDLNEKEEVSLDTLKPAEVDKIMKAFTSGRDAADNFYKSTIEPKIIKRIDIYDASKALYKRKFPRLSESSDWISRDVKTTIDWLIPSLIEVFTGSDDPVDIQGVNTEDDDKAKRIQQLIKYFVQRKNNFFVFMYSLIKEGLKTNFGIAKVSWKRDEERVGITVIMARIEQLPEMIMLHQSGKIELHDIDPITETGDLFKVSYEEIRIKTNIPVLENLPPSELRFTPEARSIHEAKFVAHRKIVKGDYLKRKENEGIYRNVDGAIEENGDVDYTNLDKRNNPGYKTNYTKKDDNDNASKDIELYEAYLKVDYNNDGVYENLIVHAVGETPLRITENTFEMPPFFIFSPEYDSYGIFSDGSFADILEQLQDLKTALIRQVIIAVAKNNIPQKFVDLSKVDVAAMEDGDEIVDAGNMPQQNIFIPPQAPISPLTMELVQYSQNEIEAQSGSTRYNQGLDSNSLNKTATGINAIMGAADKKIRLIARLLAETTWIPLIKFLILLCQKFLEQEQVIRLENENVVVNKNELDIDYDLIVNVGQGAGTKEASIQQMMILLQQLYPKLEQLGVVDENSWYNMVKKLLEKMGMRDVTAYLIDPSSPEVQQQKAQMMQQQMQQQQAAQQAAAAAEAEKSKPKLSVSYKDLPPDAKAQLLKSFGIETTEEAVMQKELFDKGR